MRIPPRTTACDLGVASLPPFDATHAMKFAESLLAVCVLGLAGFIGAQSLDMRAERTRSEAAGAIEVGQPARSAARKGLRSTAVAKSLTASAADASEGAAYGASGEAAGDVRPDLSGDSAAVVSPGGVAAPADPAGASLGMTSGSSPRF